MIQMSCENFTNGTKICRSGGEEMSPQQIAATSSRETVVFSVLNQNIIFGH